MKLLVIDVQKGIMDERLYHFQSLVKNIQILTETARKQGIEVIYVQHDDGPNTGFSLGDEEFEIYEGVKPNKDEKCFVKTKCSCFSNEELKRYLQDEIVLIFVGLQTNYCIDASIKTAFDLGYTVIVPKDCNSTFDNPYMDAKTTVRYYNEWIWPERFAKCLSVEETLQLMLK